ncbi:hypothetical protein B0O99DRAFT_600454 [Bisporella sp. PMI_857]|nr:hypothetical protein B0O99DRAFT_600454 [Bisporella sp. PMI_857]
MDSVGKAGGTGDKAARLVRPLGRAVRPPAQENHESIPRVLCCDRVQPDEAHFRKVVDGVAPKPNDRNTQIIEDLLAFLKEEHQNVVGLQARSHDTFTFPNQLSDSAKRFIIVEVTVRVPNLIFNYRTGETEVGFPPSSLVPEKPYRWFLLLSNTYKMRSKKNLEEVETVFRFPIRGKKRSGIQALEDKMKYVRSLGTRRREHNSWVEIASNEVPAEYDEVAREADGGHVLKVACGGSCSIGKDRSVTLQVLEYTRPGRAARREVKEKNAKVTMADSDNEEQLGKGKVKLGKRK